MLFAQQLPPGCRAFPFIQRITIVVVLALLAVPVALDLLCSLPLPVKKSAIRAYHSLQLKQLEMSLHAYKERFGEFPPDGLPAGGFTRQELFESHVRKAFPHCTNEAVSHGWTAYGQYQNPATALAFWLGGILDENGNSTGFSANPADPFGGTTGGRIGPFFDFDAERLARDANHEGMRYYYPTVQAQRTGDPDRAIRYYRAEGGSYAGKGFIPFKDSREPRPAPDDFEWINPRSFQIISPGLGGAAFAEPGTNPRFPDGPYTDAQLDMMSNFTSGTMKDAMP